jgi:hypothetical protein
MEKFCDQASRIMCKDCIVLGPHRLHENIELNDAFKILNGIRDPMEKTLNSFDNLENMVIEPFKRI